MNPSIHPHESPVHPHESPVHPHDLDKKAILVQAGVTRLRPIILTTVTTIGGLIPMAFFASGASKTWQPMAVTIIWGIAFATILTLFLIPVIYKILDDIKWFFGFLFSKVKGSDSN